MSLATLLEEKRQVVETALGCYIPLRKDKLSEAIHYSMFAGGKRLRPILALLSFQAAGGRSDQAILPAACALELVHTFTLIHDDLPSMDDDDFRRGKPSSHKKFGEGMAVLAGDALMIDGLGLMAKSTANPAYVNRAISEFSRTLGSMGVTLGQADDLYGDRRDPSFLRHVHLRKTALFVAFSLQVGALMAEASDVVLESLHQAGILAGMGFQIRDDVLDVVSSREQLGKTPGKDAQEEKLTYPGLYGVERASAMALKYAKKSQNILFDLGKRWEILTELISHLVERER